MEKTENPERIANPRRASGRLEANPEDVRNELERILSSQAFRGIESHKNFLRYAVEQTIQGHGNLIKEYSVGIEVFGRGGSFDPRVDPIVRIQAGRLRSRLAKYYATEGEQDPLRIEFPKGSYAPVFRHPPEAAVSDANPQHGTILQPPPTGASFWNAMALNRTTAGALLVVILLVAGGVGFWLRSGRAGKSPAVDAPSLAVLPFLNRSDNKEDEVFSDGLTDELIDSLGRIPGLHVVARTSSFQYKGKVLDIRKIGQELNVRTVLEGSVRKYGNRLRITAQLDDTTNGYGMWSESYDRELKDTLAIQAEISRAITNALGVKLGDKRASRLNISSGRATSVPPEAYKAYLMGLFFFNKNTAEEIEKAISFFQEAIGKYPAYALAYVGLAHCYAQIPVFEDTPSMEVVPKMRAAASKALELDSTLGEAHLDLARAFETEFNWPEAEREFQTASQLSPEDAVGDQWYAVHLWRMGRLEEALVQNKTALELDPISPGATHAVGRALYFLGRNDDAVDEYQKALALEPNSGIAHSGLGLAYLAKGAYSQAVSEMELSYRLMGGDAWHAGQLGYVYGMSGNMAGANKMLSELLNRSKPPRALAIATIYIGLRDRDRAFEWLQKAVDQHDVFLLLKADPQYTSLRSDPRYAGLLRRMKLN